jgi:hypothetical protein
MVYTEGSLFCICEFIRTRNCEFIRKKCLETNEITDTLLVRK